MHPQPLPRTFGVLRAVALGLALVAVTVRWLRLEPSVTPADVELTAVVQRAGPDTPQVFSRYPWQLLVTLNSVAGKNLGDLGPDGQRRYRYTVYPFFTDRDPAEHDFLQGLKQEYDGSQRLVVPSGWGNIGGGYETRTPAQEALRRVGFPLGRYPENRDGNLLGFTYWGDEWPARNSLASARRRPPRAGRGRLRSSRVPLGPGPELDQDLRRPGYRSVATCPLRCYVLAQPPAGGWASSLPSVSTRPRPVPARRH